MDEDQLGRHIWIELECIIINNVSALSDDVLNVLIYCNYNLMFVDVKFRRIPTTEKSYSY